jgi:serine/threonine protein kinase
MEYLPAGDLFHYVCEYERLVEDDCREIVSQIVSGLALMHAEGFAHRDVNPKVCILLGPQHRHTLDNN